MKQLQELKVSFYNKINLFPFKILLPNKLGTQNVLGFLYFRSINRFGGCYADLSSMVMMLYMFFTSAWILPILELNCQLWVIHKSFHLHVTFISQPYICQSFITRNWYPSFPLALLTKLLYRPMIPLIYYYLNKKSIKDIKIIPRFMAKRKLYDLKITLWRSNVIKVWFSLWNNLNFTHLGHVSL